MSWIRKKKKYSRPKKPYDKKRIDEEKEVVKRYGLKNKKEIWKAEAKISRFRDLAKKLIRAGPEEQNKLIEHLRKIGFKVEKIADILALTKEDWFKRRLQTVLFEKGLTTTPKQARQMITHKHVTVNGRVVNIPSYVVEVNEENKIELIKSKKMEEIKKMNEIEGIAHVFTSFNNTIVHVTDLAGRTIGKASGGQVTKHNRLKANPTIAMFVAKKVAEQAKDFGITSLYVRIKAKTGSQGAGPGAHSVVKSLSKEGIKVINIVDVTCVPRGGPKKKGGKRGRRV